jgi:hypothetical protein
MAARQATVFSPAACSRRGGEQCLMESNAEENPYKSPEYCGKIAREPSNDDLPHERAIRSAVRWALGQSLVFAIVAMLVLDGGYVARRWAFALIVSWAATVMILLRYKYGRSHVFTEWDAVIIKYSVWLVFFLALWLRIGTF